MTMAYVPITDSLVYDIRQVVREMESKDLAANDVGTISREISLDTAQATVLVGLMDSHFWAGLIDIKDRIPSDWCTASDMVQMHCALAGDQKQAVGSDHIIVDFKMPTIYKAPPRSASTGYRSALNVSAASMNFQQFAESLPAYQEILRKFALQKQLRTQWHKVDEQLVAFLRRSKSLNEALKLWPDVRLYVPTSYLAKADAKKAKDNDRPDPLAGLDMEQVTAAYVGMRVSGGSA
jgi:hypothetical protein